MIGLVGLIAIATPNLPIPVRLPAEVDDAYALRLNPAGLGYLRGGELRLLYGRRSETPGLEGAPNVDGAGLFAAFNVYGGLTLGAGFELELKGPDAAHRVALGLGVELGGFGSGRLRRRMNGLSLGLSFENISPFEGDDKQVLSSGVSMRWSRWLSTALAIRDLAQTADRRAWDLGIAVRPYGERFLLSTRWRITQSEPINSDTLDLTFLAQVEPIDGLSVIGTVDLELNFNVQLALSLEKFGAGGSVSYVEEDLSFSGELFYRSRGRPAILAPKRVAVLDLTGALKPDDSIDLLAQKLEVAAYGQTPLLLEALKNSEEVAGVLIRMGPLSVGWAKAQEVRAGLTALRTSGRRVDCYLSGVDDLSYFVASACTTIMVPPPLSLSVDGISAESMYFADTLDALGVKVDVVKRGRFKSSPEQYTRSGMSSSQQLALNAYLDALYAALVEGIASARKLTAPVVESLIERGTLTSTEAKRSGLVDAVVYPDEVEAQLKRYYGGAVRYSSASALVAPQRPRWSGRPQIAVVHIDAVIDGGDSTDLPFGLGQTVGSRTVVAALERVRTDPNIKAVVLRVDSPGGSAFASDLIARAVRKVKKVKPVVASFGDIAASGGYYVAALAQTIFAEPTTLTGSIGVFSLKISAADLMGRLGIGVTTLKRGSLSDANTFTRGQTPEERDRMARGVDDAYRIFLGVVAEGRGMSEKAVHEVAQGRIWSGKDARKAGLVDELGGLMEAVARAKALAGVDSEVSILTLPANRKSLPGPLRPLAKALSVEKTALPVDLGALLPEETRLLLRTLFLGKGQRSVLAISPTALRVR